MTDKPWSTPPGPKGAESGPFYKGGDPGGDYGGPQKGADPGLGYKTSGTDLGGTPGSTTVITETTRTSWLERMKRAITGVAVGFALVAGSAALLWWNEGRAVQTARSLAEGASAVVSVDPARADRANDGKLVHFTGGVTTTGPVADEELGISADGVVLRRNVEMYQWRELSESRTRERVGGGTETVTTYRYELAWSDRVIDSNRFREPQGHANPPSMRYGDRQFAAPGVQVGAFALPDALVRDMPGAARMALSADQVAGIGARAQRTAQQREGMAYLSRNPDRPMVGDLRIAYDLVPRQTVSVIGQQQGGTVAPYQSRAGDRLLMLRAGPMTADAMFQKAEEENRILTWILRGVGVLLMFVGFKMIMAPIAMLGAVLPILSQLAQLGTSIIAFVLTAVLAPLVIAIAWLAVRPVVAAVVLAVGAVLAVGGMRMLRSRAKTQARAIASDVVNAQLRR